MATRQDIIDDVLIEMGVLDAGETPDATSSNDVGKVVDRYHAQLVSEGHNTWGAAVTDLTDPYIDHFVKVIAAKAARAFGLSSERRSGLNQTAFLSERKLKELAHADDTLAGSAIEYF